MGKQPTKTKRRPIEQLNPFQFIQEKKEHSIPVRMGSGLLKWIDNHAKDMNMHRSSVVLQALIEYISREEGMREAKLEFDLQQMFESMSKHIELVPNDHGGLTMQIVSPGVVRLDGEEGEPEEKNDGQ